MGNRDGWTLKGKTGIMQQQRVWTVACEELDRITITRLCELVQHDGDTSNRIEAFWKQRKSDKVNEEQLLSEQLEKVTAQIGRLDKLLTEPEVPLSTDAERSYIEMLREAEIDRGRLLKKQATRDQQRNPADVVPNFYRVLTHLPSEYQHLTAEKQKRMTRQVIRDIRLNIISPHLFILRVRWQLGIAMCPDVALVWRGKGARVGYDWTPEEEAIIKSLYPDQPQIDIMRVLPRRAWQSIREHASKFGLHRIAPSTRTANAYCLTMSYADLDAVERLTDDPQQQSHLCRIADELARRTVRGALSAHWWLPLVTVSYAGTTDADDSGEPGVFNVSSGLARHR